MAPPHGKDQESQEKPRRKPNMSRNPKEAKRRKSEMALSPPTRIATATSSDPAPIELQKTTTEALRAKVQQLEEEATEYQIKENEKRHRFIATILALQAERAPRIPGQASKSSGKATTSNNKAELPEPELKKLSTKELEALAQAMAAEEEERKELIKRIVELEEQKKCRCD